MFFLSLSDMSEGADNSVISPSEKLRKVASQGQFDFVRELVKTGAQFNTDQVSYITFWLTWNHIGGVMVSILTLSVVDRGFVGSNHRWLILIFAKDTALRSRSKGWLVQNQYNVSLWSDMSTRGLLFQLASTIKIQLRVLVQYKVDIIIIAWKVTFSHHDDIAEKLLIWH